MPRSMTGFGRGLAEGECHRLGVEIRSVNHRFLDINVHLPRQFSWWEPKVREALAAAVSRGRVDVFLDAQEETPLPRRLQVDTDLALAYHNSLGDLKAKLGLEGRLDVATLALIPDIFTLQDLASSYQAEEPHLDQALACAIEGMLEMREREGRRMVSEMIRQLDEVEEMVVAVRERAPSIVDEFRGRLERRVRDLGLEPDSDRFSAEVVYYAERANVAEEIVRLESHLGQARDALSGVGEVGRKLNFILQEMNREINTIGSKTSDVVAGQAVVDIKTRLEQMRELVQNLE